MWASSCLTLRLVAGRAPSRTQHSSGDYPHERFVSAPKRATISLLSIIYPMKKALVVSASTLFALPLVAFAAVNNLTDAGSLLIDIINQIIVPVLFAIAFIVFVWGAFQT